MTAITLRAAHTAPSDRLIVALGLALVRYGHARAARRERAVLLSRALLEAERRRRADERFVALNVGMRR